MQTRNPLKPKAALPRGTATPAPNGGGTLAPVATVSAALDPGARARKSAMSRSHWELCRERFRIGDEAPPPPERVSMIGDIIKTVLRRIDAERPPFWNDLCAQWPELVGAQVAAHARPGRMLPRKMLLAYVDNSTWMHELTRMQGPRVLAAVQRRFGTHSIAQVKFQVGVD